MSYKRFVSEVEVPSFKLWSSKTHGAITLPISLGGAFLNLVTIAVFLQRSMRSPTNYILLAISVFDILLMISYIPYTIYFYIIASPDPNVDQSSFWPYYALMYSHFSLFTHGCSVWLTCFLAFYRYKTVSTCMSRASSQSLLLRLKNHTIIAAMLLTVFCCISLNVVSYNVREDCYLFIRPTGTNSTSNHHVCAIDNDTQTALRSKNETKYIIDNLVSIRLKWAQLSEHAVNFPMLYKINFWTNALLMRTIPCLFLIVLSFMLIYIMHVANENRLKLMQQGRKREYEKAGEFNRTTTMLLIVVVSFLLMEFPHGIFYIFCAISEDFFNDVYVPLGDLLDVLVLINSSINFFLFCVMSSQFRDKFKQIFLHFKFTEPVNAHNLNGARFSISVGKSFNARKSVVDENAKAIANVIPMKTSKEETALLNSNDNENLA